MLRIKLCINLRQGPFFYLVTLGANTVSGTLLSISQLWELLSPLVSEVHDFTFTIILSLQLLLNVRLYLC